MHFEGVKDGSITMLTVELADGTRTVSLKATGLLPGQTTPEGRADRGVLELHWGCVKEDAEGDGWSFPPTGAVLPDKTRDPDGDGMAARSAFGPDGSLVGRAVNACASTHFFLSLSNGLDY